VHIIFVDDHSNQLVTQDKSQDYPSYRDDDRLGQGADKIEHVGVPPLRGLPDLPGYLADLSVHLVKHSREVGDYAVREHLPNPSGDCVCNPVHPLSTPLWGLKTSSIVNLHSFLTESGRQWRKPLTVRFSLWGEPLLCFGETSVKNPSVENRHETKIIVYIASLMCYYKFNK
jgi:hypothetical protein